MGSQIWPRGLCFLLCFFCCSFVLVSSQTVAGEVSVGGVSAIGYIDEDFVCATLDWWPPEKCDYGTCSWDHASILNLDLDNTILLKATKALSPLKIRLGGTLQDRVIYETDDNQKPCAPFAKDANDTFGFSEGCLPMDRWDELNAFFEKTGVKLVFGLNALNGRSVQSDGTVVGDWDYSNAESFLRYTAKKNYGIYGWELGNELSGNGQEPTPVAADQYASDTTTLYNLVQDIYSGSETKPLILAPGGLYVPKWFNEFVDKTTDSLQVVTHHMYNLGPGSQSDEQLINKILNYSVHDYGVYYISGLQSTLKNSTTSATAWVGEAGGAYNSGHNGVTNAFVFSFWYLDELGMASAYDTKTYCRQTLIGGNYGLLDTKTFVPNPDYYSALLWQKLMGRNVLLTKFSGSKNIRAYTHCAKKSEGITVLLINLDKTTTFKVNVAMNSTWKLELAQNNDKSDETNMFQFPQGPLNDTSREEYHLTAKDGDLQSRNMLLNGNILTINSDGDIPSMEPVNVNPTEPITVAPLSIVFAHVPYIVPAACK